MQNIAIFGATSGIAQAVFRSYCKDGNRIVLVARSRSKLDTLKVDSETRGENTEITTLAHDFGDNECLGKIVDQILDVLGFIDVALVAYGTLPDQNECEENDQELLDSVAINFSSPAVLLNILARKMEAQKRGTLAVITSVAGDRGRKSNYAYGAAKAGLSIYVDGLRGRLFASGVNVLNIKPGYVSTPMTAHLHQGPLFAKAEVVAKQIVRAIQSHKSTLYTPFFWRLIMIIIKSIPEFVFKKLSI